MPEDFGINWGVRRKLSPSRTMSPSQAGWWYKARTKDTFSVAVRIPCGGRRKHTPSPSVRGQQAWCLVALSLHGSRLS